MVVGVLRMVLFLGETGSLKAKRSIRRRVVERVKNKFNVAVAEVDKQDLWQTLELGISAVGNDRRHVNSCLDKVINFVEAMNTAEVVAADIEVLSL